jgi:4-hydroxy-tetrahydrodipicolinate reductase
MRIALVGYGKMGRLIDALAPSCGGEVVVRLDEFNNAHGEGFTAANFEGVDAAIEFTAPHIAVANLLRLAELKVPTVCGTTGWHTGLEGVREAYEATATPLIYSANFSIGVNVFRRVVAAAARALAAQPDYQAWAWEIHHAAKKDAPSGTLMQLLQDMREAGYAGSIDASSNRAGAHPGTHEIGFDSAADTLTLRHVARNREGFARGALQAARCLKGRRGVWEFADVLFDANGQ